MCIVSLQYTETTKAQSATLPALPSYSSLSVHPSERSVSRSLQYVEKVYPLSFKYALGFFLKKAHVKSSKRYLCSALFCLSSQEATKDEPKTGTSTPSSLSVQYSERLSPRTLPVCRVCRVPAWTLCLAMLQETDSVISDSASLSSSIAAVTRPPQLPPMVCPANAFQAVVSVGCVALRSAFFCIFPIIAPP